MRVAILGAGITGLATAWLLRSGGADVTLYEAGSATGGLGATVRRDGWAFDLGPHELRADDPALRALLQETCEDDLIEVEKRTAQRFRGRDLRYPFETTALLRALGPSLSLRALGELLRAGARNALRAPADGSFASWTRERFGRTLYESYFEPYTRKVWGLDPADLDADVARQRIAADSVWDLLKKTLALRWLGVEDTRRAHSEHVRTFLYTRGGIGTLQQRLCLAVERAGGRIELGKRLVGADARAGAVRALRFADGSRAERFDQVVSTIPLPLLVRALLGARAEPLLETCALPFRAMAFVLVRVARPRVGDWHWVYYPEPDVPWQRMTEFAHFGAGMTPPGTTGVTLELSCAPGDATWGASDGELCTLCIGRMEELSLLRRADVLGADVVRVEHAYPLQVKGFARRVQQLVAALGEAENLVTVGRQGLFRYCNIDECVRMALDVAPRLLAGEGAIRYAHDPTWTGAGLERRAARVRAS